MTKVIASEDCGNSPKNKFLQDLTIAFATADSQFILDKVAGDVRWNIVGNTRIEGKDNFSALLKQRENDRALELTIQHIATHGKAGAVNGTVTLENGRTRAFCDVYEFMNTKGSEVKEITSSIIESR